MLLDQTFLGGPLLLFRILDLFLNDGDDLQLKKELTSEENENRKDTIRLFCSHFGRCWDCSGCEYWELPWTKRESSITKTAYSTTHGAKTLIGDVQMFCTYFIVRKCMMGQEERKDAVRCMIELVSFLSAKGYLTDDEYAKQIISSIRPGLTFEPDTIQQKLCELWAKDYWRTLKEEKESSKKVKTDQIIPIFHVLEKHWMLRCLGQWKRLPAKVGYFRIMIPIQSN